MHQISRKYRHERREFTVYSLDEFTQMGGKPVPWRQAKVGDWAITDDNYVCEYLAEIKIGKTGLIMEFSCARCMTGQKKPFLFEERLQTRDWWSITPRSWQGREARRARTKQTVQAFAAQIISGTVDFKVLGQIYRPNQAIPEATVRRLLKQEEIKHMVREEIAKTLSKNGVTPDRVIQIINEAVEIAKKKGDPGNMLRGAENFSEMLEMKPKLALNSPPPIPVVSEEDFAKLMAAEDPLPSLTTGDQS